MTEETQTQPPEVAWVRTQIPDLCRQNAHAISQASGMNIEAIYRHILTWFLWGEEFEALANWEYITNPPEEDYDEET